MHARFCYGESCFHYSGLDCGDASVRDPSLADGGIGHAELKLHLKELGARQDFFKLFRLLARQREVSFYAVRGAYFIL